MPQSDYTPEELANYVFKKLNNVKGDSLLPDKVLLSTLFKRLFSTSLKTEEGQFIKVTVTFINPANPDPSPPERIVKDRWQLAPFRESIPFTVKNLIKLSKAADPWSSSLAVYHNEKNELIIWGMIDQAIHYQSFLNYEQEEGPEQPGLFQVTITGIGNLIVMFDYELIATLKQDVLITNYIDVFRRGEIHKILKENSNILKEELVDYINTEYPHDVFPDWRGYLENLIYASLSRILIRIQNYNHGGAFVITPNIGKDLDIKYSICYNRLFDSIINLTKFNVSNYNVDNEIFERIDNLENEYVPVDLHVEESVSENDVRETLSELKGAIRFIASLTCVDGLVLLTPELKVKGFGTVIKFVSLPDKIYISKISVVILAKLVPVNIDHFGTRHRSMFSYCWNNSGSLGFVVSQDGDIRVITRVSDKLIMWENIKVQHFLKSENMKRKRGPNTFN